MNGPDAPRRGALRAALLALLAVALVALGGGLAVALGIGARETPSSDSVDAGFSRDMSRHHLQGVEMANLALDRSTDAAVRGLAFDISATQTNQAGRMQGWLSLWGLPPTDGEPMAWMSGGGDASGHAMSRDDVSGDDTAGDHMAGDDMAGHDMGGDGGSTALMPGMATEEELAGLRSLSGRAFDVEFLRLMIRHHQGGLEMARDAAAHAQEAAVRSLARAIADTQTAETDLMAGMLSERGGTPLPEP